MTNSKYTDGLINLLEQHPENVEVIIELAPSQTHFSSDASRDEKIAQSKSAFQEQLRPVVEVIESEGGDILGATWLNQTIKAKVNTHCLDDLASLQSVAAIDVPRRLSRGVL